MSRPGHSVLVVYAATLLALLVILAATALSRSLLLGIVLVLLVGTWGARRLRDALCRLRDAAKAYAKGDFTPQLPASSLREVNELADALQTLAQAMHEHIGRLTTERNQATAMLDGMAEGVMALDAQGQILLMNPAAKMLLGVASADGGRHALELLRHPEAHALLQAVLQRQERSTKDVTLFQPKERILRLHGVPCQGTGPTGPSAVLVIQDVTEINRYEQLRKEFVANVSHELKSPLTSIRSLTETLLAGALGDPANNRRFVRLIDDDAARLSRLIDDLLALSQIESQAVPLQPAVVELQPLVASVLESLQPVVRQRRLTATLDVPPGMCVRADPDRLRQVLVNLLENAMKYNKETGTVLVSAVRHGDWVQVTVADTGIGIPEADVPRIFERFYRVDKARSRELGGTGLGLSIVKHIVEAHGGRVSVESEPNRGSKFLFTIPVAS